MLSLSGNLQEYLEASPCPAFSLATRHRRHRSVRGTSILQFVLTSPRSDDQYVYFIYVSYHWLFCCIRCIDSNHNEDLIDSDGFKSIWRHLHAFLLNSNSPCQRILIPGDVSDASRCGRLFHNNNENPNTSYVLNKEYVLLLSVYVLRVVSTGFSLFT